MSSHPRASVTTPLDCIETSNEGANALKTVGQDEPYLVGHYPDNPVYPGVFLFDLCEKLASACPAIARPFDHVDSLRFMRPVLPGDIVRIGLGLRRSAAGEVVGASFVGRSDNDEKLFTARMSYA